MTDRWGIAQREDGQWVTMRGTRQLALSADRDGAFRALSTAYAAATDAPELAPGQQQFEIPLLIAEGVDSADLRFFNVGAGTTRDLPLPLMLLTDTPDWGHTGAVICGRIDSIQQMGQSEPGPAGLGNARGVYLATDEGRMAAMLAEQQVCNGISADLDQLDVEWEEVGEPDEMGFVDARMIATSYRVAGATQCTIPAFPMCSVRVVPMADEAPSAIGADEMAAARLAAEQSAPTLRLALTTGERERRQAATRRPVLAAAIDEVPVAPASWFTDPQLTDPTPLTVTPEGRVYGHLCLWGTPHRGADGEVILPPRNVDPNYGQFRLGAVDLDDGTSCSVGHLTVGTGHAAIRASVQDTRSHYDNTGAAAAQVTAGNDHHGVWVAGWVSPFATPEQIYALRASALSGDWRYVGARRELVAALSVPVAGFPVPRAQGHSENGRPLALVAAGARELFLMKQPVERQDYDRLLSRLEQLEDHVLPQIASAALQRFDALADADA